MDGSAEARRRALDNARAILGFAGEALSPEAEAIAERFARGELTEKEFVAELTRPGR